MRPNSKKRLCRFFDTLRPIREDGAQFYGRIHSRAITWYIIMKWHTLPRRMNTWKISWQPKRGLFRPGHFRA